MTPLYPRTFVANVCSVRLEPDPNHTVQPHPDLPYYN
jgi:hypothetical protein